LRAQAAFREALEIFSKLGQRRGTSRALEGAACLALARGQAARALTLAAAAAHLRKLISAPLRQEEQLKLDNALLPAWESLGGDGKVAWAMGSAMNMEQAIDFSLDRPATAISRLQDQ
jgi:predicted DNA-binding transcriptional regulator YafY